MDNDFLLEFIAAPLLVLFIGWMAKQWWDRRTRNKELLQKKKDAYESCIWSLGSDKNQMELLEQRYFIPIMGQQEGPHDDTDVIKPAPNSRRYNIAQAILDEISPKKGKITTVPLRYSILAGSGMGKSIFSASFIKEYYGWKRYKNEELPCKLLAYNLFDENCISKLEADLNREEYKQKDKLIVVLDSLDENRAAIENYEQFMDRLEELTNDVRVVILTSRTQFFDSKEDELTEGAVKQGSGKRLKWKRHYLSPFSDEEKNRYIDMRYNYAIGTPEFEKAYHLVNDMQSDVMRRPLILSYVDELLNVQFVVQNKPTNAEVYHEIIKRWIRREVELNPMRKGAKQDRKQREKEEKESMVNLYEFTKKIAVYIYSQQNGFAITEEEYNAFLEENNLNQDTFSFKSRSLLNRTNDGKIKFAHKSFLEYFIAIDSLENPWRWYDPSGLEMAPLFAEELMFLHRQKRNFGYVHIVPSPMPEKTKEGAALTEDFFATWNEYIKGVRKENELKNDNIYFMLKYWHAMMYDISGADYIDREVKAAAIQDQWADGWVLFKKEHIEHLQKFEDTTYNKRNFGQRMLNEKIKSYISNRYMAPMLQYADIVYPAMNNDHVPNNSLTYTIGRGFMKDEKALFETIRHLCCNRSLETMYEVPIRHEGQSELETKTLFPVTIMVYRYIDKVSFKEVMDDQSQYLFDLGYYLRDDLQMGQKIIVHFFNDLISYDYLISYNSVIYDVFKIYNCLDYIINAAINDYNLKNNQKELQDMLIS